MLRKSSLILFLVIAKALLGQDPDGVAGQGLFPIGDNQLAILKEEVTVTLNTDGFSVHRFYKVQNRGDTDTVRLGTNEYLLSLDEDSEERNTITVDGKLINGDLAVSYLRDRGSYVEVKPLTIEELWECQEHVDGNYCGAVWNSFDLIFLKGIRLDIPQG
jgi:hypothetical protein